MYTLKLVLEKYISIKFAITINTLLRKFRRNIVYRKYIRSKLSINELIFHLIIF